MTDLNSLVEHLREDVLYRHNPQCIRHGEWPCEQMTASCSPGCSSCLWVNAPCPALHALQALEITLDALDDVAFEMKSTGGVSSVIVMALIEHVKAELVKYLDNPTVY